jgi:hypothetical protein
MISDYLNDIFENKNSDSASGGRDEAMSISESDFQKMAIKKQHEDDQIEMKIVSVDESLNSEGLKNMRKS